MLLDCDQLGFSTLNTVQDTPPPPHLGNDATYSGLSLPTSIKLIKTIFHRYAHRPTHCRPAPH